MADIDPQMLSEAFLKALKDYHGDTGSTGTSSVGGSIGGGAGGIDSKLVGLGKQVDSITKGMKQSQSGIAHWTRVLRGGEVGFTDISERMQDFEKLLIQARKEGKANAVLHIQTQKAKLAEQAAINNTRAAVTNFATGTMAAFKNTMVPAIGTFVKSLQGDASGTELAAGLMTGALNMAGNTMESAGNAAGMAGGALSQFSKVPGKAGKAIKGLGVALQYLGPIIGSTAKGMTELAKFGVDLLKTEVERTVKAFGAASTAGAMYADGMTGVRNAAMSAGLTTEQFSKVLQEQSATIASAGLGVGEGAKLVGGALKAGGNDLKRELLNLGYSFEDQAGLVAETMANMRQSGKALTSGDQAAIAQQTAKYAENLRVVTAITGEDARKKMDAVKQQAAQLAFQQKLADMDAVQRDNVNNAMMNMSDQQRKNFMETVVFGNVINKTGAAMESTMPNFAAANAEMMAQFNQGTLDAQSARAVNAQYAEGVRQDLLNNKEIGMAGMAGVGGIVGDLNKIMGEELQFRQKFNEKAIKDAEAATAGQKATEDKLTGEVTGAAKAAQDLKIALQETLTPAIGKFSELSLDILSGVKKALSEANLLLNDKGEKVQADGTTGEKGTIAKIKEWLSTSGNVSGALTAAGAATTTVGAVASATGVGALGGIPLAAIGGIITGLGAISGMLGFARGGVAEGPDTGYLTKLHGKELIIPLTSAGEIAPGTEGLQHALTLLDNARDSGTASKKSSTSAVTGQQTAGIKIELPDLSAQIAKQKQDFEIPSMQLASPLAVMGSMATDALTGVTNLITTAFGGKEQEQDPYTEQATGSNEQQTSLLARLVDLTQVNQEIAQTSEQVELLRNAVTLLQEMVDSGKTSVDYQRTIAENTF